MIGQTLDYTIQIVNGITTKTIWRATETEARAEFDKAIAEGATSVIVKHFSLVVMLREE